MVSVKMERNAQDQSDELRSPNEIVSSSNEGEDNIGFNVGTSSKRSASATTTNTNRNSRTSRACEGCRKKKIACNGRQPCKACSIRKRDCVYTTLTVTGRPSKGAVKLLQKQIEQLEAEIEMLRSGGGGGNGGENDSQGGFFTKRSKLFDSGEGMRKLGEIPLNRSFGPLGTTNEIGLNNQNEVHRDSITGGEDDFHFLAQNLNKNLSIIPTINSPPSINPPLTGNNASSTNPNVQNTGTSTNNQGTIIKQVNIFDLHTSFRLERQENGDFSSSLGWCMTALRLGESVLNGKNFFENRGGEVDEIKQFGNDGEGVGNRTYPNQPPPHPPHQRNQSPIIEPFIASNILLHWPSREREEQLFNVYFRLVQPTWPILCKDTLKAQRIGSLRNIFQNDPIWISIMLGLFISAGRYIPMEYENLRFWWTARMQLGGHDLIHCSSIGGVQNLLMTIQVRSVLVQRTHIDWVAAGMAIRAMQDRGLHREAVLKTLQRDPAYVSLIRCLWWAAQKADIDLCSRWGRTPAAVSFDVLPPRGSTMSSPIPYFIASLRGLRITSQILDVRYLRDRELRESITGEIQRWLAELKEYFPFIPKERDDEKIFASAKLTLFANSVVSLAYKPSIYLVFRSLTRFNNGTKTKREMTELELNDYEKAKTIMKEVIQNTAKITKALMDRSRQDVQFFDDDLAAHVGSAQIIACLLCFAEKLRGIKDDNLFNNIATISDAISRCTYNGTTTSTAREFCKTMMNQLTKKMTNDDDEERRGNMADCNNDFTNPPPPPPFSTFPNQHQQYPFDQSFSIQANMCLTSDNPHLPPSIPSTTTTFDQSTRDVQMFDSMYTNPITNKLTKQNDQASTMFRTAISMMDRYTEPRILMDNVQYAKASPDSKLWDDVLHNEIMLLDGMTNTTAGFPYSQFCVSQPQIPPPPLPTHNLPSNSSVIESSTASDFSEHDKRINSPNMLELTTSHHHQHHHHDHQTLQQYPPQQPPPPNQQNFGNLGMRRGSAQIPILSSIWLGPDVENVVMNDTHPHHHHHQHQPQGDLNCQENEGLSSPTLPQSSNLPRFHVSNIFSSNPSSNVVPSKSGNGGDGSGEAGISSTSNSSTTNPNFQTLPAPITEDFQGFSNALNAYKIQCSSSSGGQQSQSHSPPLQQSSIDPHSHDPSWQP